MESGEQCGRGVTGDRAIAKRLHATPTPTILALNKVDLLPAADVLPRTEAYRALLPEAAWILFSAQKGHGEPEAASGRDELLTMIVAALPEGPHYYPEDQVTDSYVRDMAAEFIREQIMLQLRDEVLYGTAVQILEFKERDSGDVYISANIFVDRDTHKRIIIGKKGQQLKEIGAAARAQLEELVGCKVFLELWVKVEPKWRQNEKWLKRLGYARQE
ncbi:MAG: GTPase Era [Chloroflexi bacterium]|nr:GTPase Era [Ardenticatenaceae bacterium]NOG37130.1 GTPase Era [Chloroflexota bacterium]